MKLSFLLSFCRLVSTLMDGVSFTDRLVVAMNLVLPSVSQVIQMAAFVVTLRAILLSIRVQPSNIELVCYGAVIFFTFLLSSLVKLYQVRAVESLRKVIEQRVRSLMGAKFIAVRQLPEDDRKIVYQRLVKDEAHLLTNGVQAVQKLVLVMASAIMVVVLMSFVTIFVPLIGLTVVLLASLGVFFLRKTFTRSKREGKVFVQRKRGEAAKLSYALAMGGEGESELLKRYENGFFERHQINDKRRTEVMGVVIACLMGIVMVMALVLMAKGNFSGWHPLLLLALIFSLRISLVKAQEIANHLAFILSERKILFFITREEY